MIEGLLFFIKDPNKELADKINWGATRYREKFGRCPTTCYLNTADLNGEREINGIRLRAVPNIQRYHYWIGVERESVVAKSKPSQPALFEIGS